MIALSFDIEEFDLPLENGRDLPFDRQIEVSRIGAEHILDILSRHNIQATFFTTVKFAHHAPGVVSRLLTDGHELASHGMRHTGFETGDLKESRVALEAIAQRDITGFRMPRMMKLPECAVAEAGYLYDSSLNPTFIPGRYMNLGTPRMPFMKDGVLQIPTSVTPWIRFPMFWLSAHLLSPTLYRALAIRILRHNGLFTTYFHPWEFFHLNTLKECRLPAMVRLNSGERMQQRLERFITVMKRRGERFVTYHDVYAHYHLQHSTTPSPL